MSEASRHYYEGMFLFSQATAVDLQGVVDHVNEILSRAGADLVAMKKWDERRLAHEIDKQKRGTFILTYFSASPDRIPGIERDCKLSEKIMRVMLLRADHLTEDEMRAADAREELATEARLRAERAAEQEADASSGISLGAPTAEEDDLSEDGADDEDLAEDKTAEATSAD